MQDSCLYLYLVMMMRRETETKIWMDLLPVDLQANFL